MSDFATCLLAWFDTHGRHDLPWTQPRTPYRVWLSEIMLQQTQVATVIPYFRRFVAALPDLPALAAAPLDEVLALWSGLGYYSRARHLHQAARICQQQHGGALPEEFAALAALPGIGRSTAGAILAQAHGKPWPILDGNVKRVLARVHGIEGWPGSREVEKRLWHLAEAALPQRLPARARMADYTQAQMDLGATVCTRSRPRCEACPLSGGCLARQTGRTAELPGKRPSKPLPLRQTQMLWLRDASGHTLLLRRPSRGIWGALWSLPEAADHAALQQLASRHVQLATPMQPLPAFVHVFSHFRLNIQPFHAHGQRLDLPAGQADAALRWAAPEELATLGLPAPIRKLIEDSAP